MADSELRFSIPFKFGLSSQAFIAMSYVVLLTNNHTPRHTLRWSYCV